MSTFPNENSKCSLFPALLFAILLSLFFSTLMILFPLTMWVKFPGSSAVKVFARCTRKRTFSLSFMLLSGVTLSCLILSSANSSFVKFFIMSSASTGDSVGGALLLSLDQGFCLVRYIF